MPGSALGGEPRWLVAAWCSDWSSPLDADAWSKGEIWLSVLDLSLLKRKVVLYNVDFGHGPETITNEIVRAK